jgi:two-component system, chemotaxis family, sensor kinase CheA
MEQALELISRPGFSTRSSADEGAGRGVGLDVVQRMVRSYGGRLSLETTPGQGSVFRLRLPLTLVILEVLLVQVGGERYAVPRENVLRIIEIDPAQVVVMEGGELLPDGDNYQVLHHLDDLVQGNRTRNGAGRWFGLVAADDLAGLEQRQVVAVDRVMEIREVVVQTLSDPFLAQPGVGGATELSDGQVVLILDLPTLLRLARRGQEKRNG